MLRDASCVTGCLAIRFRHSELKSFPHDYDEGNMGTVNMKEVRPAMWL